MVLVLVVLYIVNYACRNIIDIFILQTTMTSVNDLWSPFIIFRMEVGSVIGYHAIPLFVKVSICSFPYWPMSLPTFCQLFPWSKILTDIGRISTLVHGKTPNFHETKISQNDTFRNMWAPEPLRNSSTLIGRKSVVWQIYAKMTFFILFCYVPDRLIGWNIADMILYSQTEVECIGSLAFVQYKFPIYGSAFYSAIVK